MVSSWLLKVVLGIALAGLVVFELGSPLLTRAQADDAANQIATDAAFELGRANRLEDMQQTCAAGAVKHDVVVERCELDAEGRVAVAVLKDARSLLLDRFSPTRDWYNVRVSATSAPK